MSRKQRRISGWLAPPALAVLSLLIAQSATFAQPEEANPAGSKPANVLTDLYGDPLPAGAVARLGTTRFRHGPVTRQVAFSPDGKLLASAGGRWLGLALWDPITGKQLHQIRDAIANYTLAFAPDGKTLLVGDRKLSLLDVSSRKVLRRYYPESGEITTVAFSPDGRTVAAADTQGRRTSIILIFDAHTAKKLHTVDGPEGYSVALCYSADSRMIFASGADRGEKSVRVYDVASGREIKKLPAKDEVYALACSADGKLLATAGKDRVIVLRDQKSGAPIRHLKGHEGAVWTLAFSPDDKRLASGGADGMVRLWDLDKEKPVRSWRASTANILSVGFSPDGKTLASGGGSDHAIRLWDASSGKPLHPLGGHSGLVTFLRFRPDGKTVLSYARDGGLVEWEVPASKERSRRSWSDLNGGIIAFAVSSDDHLMAGTTWLELYRKIDPVVRVWDTHTGRTLHRLMHPDGASSVDIRGDGRMLAAACSDGVVHLWDLTKGSKRTELKHKGVRKVLFSPASDHLVSAGPDVLLWDHARQKEIRRWKNAGTRALLTFSADGRLLASGDAVIQIWEVDRGRTVSKYEAPYVSSLTFSPSGRILALGNTREYDSIAVLSETIRIAEVASGQEIKRFLGHDLVGGVAFSPSGRLLASGGEDSTILLWDMTGRWRAERLAPEHLTEMDLDRLWTELGRDAPSAYRAIWSLAAAPNDACTLIRKRLAPASAPNEEHVKHLIADLASDSFAKRRNAMAELTKLEDLALPALTKELAAGPPLEVQRRVQQLIDRQQPPYSSAYHLRPIRALEVLEQIGTPQARQIVAILAGGAAQALLTREARETLKRMPPDSR